LNTALPQKVPTSWKRFVNVLFGLIGLKEPSGIETAEADPNTAEQHRWRIELEVLRDEANRRDLAQLRAQLDELDTGDDHILQPTVLI
jgi:hypothetical protein